MSSTSAIPQPVNYWWQKNPKCLISQYAKGRQYSASRLGATQHMIIYFYRIVGFELPISWETCDFKCFNHLAMDVPFIFIIYSHTIIINTVIWYNGVYILWSNSAINTSIQNNIQRSLKDSDVNRITRVLL